jgi:hypothetical protein
MGGVTDVIAGTGRVQTRFWQVWPAAQALPQAPQLELSLERDTQALLHLVSPELQAPTQTLFWQA